MSTEESDSAPGQHAETREQLLRIKDSFSRAFIIVAPAATAVIGALLYYSAYVLDRSYLARFGLSPAMFGTSAPDIPAIALPALLFGALMLIGLYRGIIKDEEPPAWMQKRIEAALRRNPIQAILGTAFWTFLLLVFAVCAVAHAGASTIGTLKANHAIYRVGNRGCLSGCVAIRLRSSPTPKQGFGKVDLIGYPLREASSITAILTKTGVAIVKTEDIAMLAGANVKGRETGGMDLFYEVIGFLPV